MTMAVAARRRCQAADDYVAAGFDGVEGDHITVHEEIIEEKDNYNLAELSPLRYECLLFFYKKNIVLVILYLL